METEKLELEMAIQDSPKSVKAELCRLYARVADLEDHITTLTTWKKEGSLEVRGWEVMVEQERRIVELEAEAVEASHRLAVAHLRADQMESQHKQATEIATAATKELAAKSERIQELEAQLYAVGAGCAHGIGETNGN